MNGEKIWIWLTLLSILADSEWVQNRYEFTNKKEIINSSHAKAKEQLLDYLYNYFEITPDTVLISNSDNGKGYTCRIFIELKKALNIRRHEHFWDAYHLNEQIKILLNLILKICKMFVLRLSKHMIENC